MDDLDDLLLGIATLANMNMTADNQHKLRQLVELARDESKFMGKFMNEMAGELNALNFPKIEDVS